MPYCPSCRSEFREGFDHCAECDEALIDELPADHCASPDAMAEFLSDKEIVPIFQGSIDGIKEMRHQLMSQRIACMIGGEDQDCGKACHPTMRLFVDLNDLPRVQQLLQKRWMQSLQVEGMELLVTPQEAAPDQEQAEATCPACGAKYQTGPEAECPDCGLYLGQ